MKVVRFLAGAALFIAGTAVILTGFALTLFYAVGLLR